MRSVVVPWLSPRRWVIASLGVALAVGPTAALHAQDAGTASDDAGSKRRSSSDRGSDGLWLEQNAQVVRRGLPRVQQCYSDLLMTWPGLSGRLTLFFVIDRAGKVGQTRIESNTSGSRDLGDCLLRAARLWTFPEPPVGHEVAMSYPFQFAPHVVPQEKVRVAAGLPLPISVPPNVPDPARPGSVEGFVERFGACGADWREGYVPSAAQRNSFEAVALARTKPVRASKAAQDPGGPKEYLYQVETCYVRALEVPAWATIKGRLSLRLAIGADGKVVAARASAAELVPELGCCIQNAALEWRFPAGGAFRVVDYAFALKQPTGRGVDVQLID
jgi:hypothetical protein